MFSFKDKVCLITGASSGIGQALARACLARGARIALCARGEEKLRLAFADVPFDRVLTVAADVSKREDCIRFVQAALDKWGSVDAVFLNAGITMRALFEEADIAVLEEVMAINFWGAVHTAKAALPSVRQRSGVLVGISSIAGYRGLPGRTGYSASKFALQGFLEALRTETLRTGMHVMWVAPGFTASAIRTTARSATGTAQGESPLAEGSLMSAEACAAHILRAAERRRRTLVLTGQGKLTVALSRLVPGWLDRLVYRHFLREPGSPLHGYGRS